MRSEKGPSVTQWPSPTDSAAVGSPLPPKPVVLEKMGELARDSLGGISCYDLP